jgi:PIN domain nuclease of toxin-antitoxin system
MQGEPGSSTVAKALPGALLSMVNFAEVISKLHERGMPTLKAQEAVANLGVRLTEFSEQQAKLVGDLRPLTRSFGLSLGDRACLALGKLSDATILTTESVWPKLAIVVGAKIQVIR